MSPLRRSLLLLALSALCVASAPAGARADTAGAGDTVVTLRAPSSLWLGEVVTLKVSASPAAPAGAVVIESESNGVWLSITSGVLDEESRFSAPWRPDAFGFVRLRAVVESDSGPVTSATRRIVVNRPNRHDVPYRFAHYIVTVIHEYKLYYYEHGENMRTFDVALGRPGYRTPVGRFRIYGKRRPAGGALGACAMFYRSRGGLAIHGTDRPWLLHRFPRPFSHGCARMLNAQVLWLYERCPRGTTVRNVR